jgi:hypothetical protein
MVDYMRYMQSQPRRNDMSDIMNVMAFTENKRKNDLTQQLLSDRDKEKTTQEELEDMKYKSSVFLKGIEIENAQDRDTFFKLNNMNVNSSGPVIEMDGPEDTILRAPRDNMIQVSILSAQGNMEAAKQYMLNPDNQFVVERKLPENFDELLFNAYKSGDQDTVNEIIDIESKLSAVGGSGRSPEFAFLPTAQGIIAGNKATGEVELKKDKDGNPYLSVSADPEIVRERNKPK